MMDLFTKELISHYHSRMPMKHFGQFFDVHISRAAGCSDDEKYKIYGRIVGERASVIYDVAHRGKRPTKRILDEIGAEIETVFSSQVFAAEIV